jgi:hypothetical protein
VQRPKLRRATRQYRPALKRFPVPQAVNGNSRPRVDDYTAFAFKQRGAGKGIADSVSPQRTRIFVIEFNRQPVALTYQFYDVKAPPGVIDTGTDVFGLCRQTPHARRDIDAADLRVGIDDFFYVRAESGVKIAVI